MIINQKQKKHSKFTDVYSGENIRDFSGRMESRRRHPKYLFAEVLRFRPLQNKITKEKDKIRE